MPRRIAVAVVLWGALALSPGTVPLEAQYAKNRPALTVGVPELEHRAHADSTDPLAHYDLAVGYWFHERFDEAEQSLRRSLEIEPRLADSYLALALLPFAKRPKLWKEVDKGKVPGEWVSVLEEASRNYERAFLIDPMVDLKIYGLLIPPGQPLYEGFAHFWAANYGAAYGWFDEIFRHYKSPKQRDRLASVLYWYHGLAAAHIGQYDVAMADLQVLLDRALEWEKTNAITPFGLLPSNEYRYVLAHVKQQAGLLDAAQALYEEALTNDLGMYFAHVQLANIHERMRRTARAVTERQRAIETLPDDSGLLYELGQTQAKARQFQAAAATLRRAMELNPHNARIPYTLGQVYRALGDHAGARAAFQRFLAIAPSRFGNQVREVRELLAVAP